MTGKLPGSEPIGAVKPLGTPWVCRAAVQEQSCMHASYAAYSPDADVWKLPVVVKGRELSTTWNRSFVAKRESSQAVRACDVVNGEPARLG